MDVHLLTLAVNAPRGGAPLAYAEADGGRITRAFTSARGPVSPDHAYPLLGASATRTAVRKGLAAMQTLCPEHFILYWCGHGSRTGIALADGLFEYDELGEALAAIPSRTRTFISNTCHAGAAWEPLSRVGGDVSGIEEDWAAALARAVPGLRLLAAVSKTAEAHEDYQIGGSLYTYALLQALCCLPGDIVAPLGTRFISDVAASARARNILAELRPNEPPPELRGPSERGPRLPLMLSQAEHPVGTASVPSFSYPSPNTGARAKLVVEVRGRRHLTTYVDWTAADGYGRRLAEGHDCIESERNAERFDRILSIEPPVLLNDRVLGPQLRSGQAIPVRWDVTITDDHSHVLAIRSFAAAYYWRRPPVQQAVQWP